MAGRFRSTLYKGRTWRDNAGAAFLYGPDAKDAGAPPGTPSLREPWRLKTADTLRPGERGTKRLAAEYGDRLVCVRYRCDPVARKRYKTVELIVSESPWIPPPGPDDLVRVRVAFAEEDLRQRVKAAGGRWLPETKAWELPLRAVAELGLGDRIVEAQGSQI